MSIALDNPEIKIDTGFSVLYSGGLDSTAVALQMGKKFTGKIHLFTLDHNFGHLFVNWSKKHNEDLRKIFGHDRVVHTIVNITDTFKKLTLKSFRKDFFEYGHFTWCLGCITSLLTHVIISNLKHKIPYAFVCSSVGGEYAVMSFPTSIETKRTICNEYGIDYRAPLLELNMRKPEERALLQRHNVWPGLKVLKGVQGVQPICLPGFQHILDNLFDIHTIPKDDKVKAFLEDRSRLIREIVEADFEKEGLDLEAHIAALKEHRQQAEAKAGS